ncbi:A24 family peptidase [Sphingomonas phyllosphaerae]|uniref:A24 family peptidase n=1 Tax=Sphingomonas phyllosphaerae TaxID=257003 RepID=UPI00040B28C1|nr:A24 family peptidase [Sphingomonas phyllosphaerae]
MDMALSGDSAGRTVVQTGNPVRALDIFRHIVCILALMWTGIVNGQPFFFPDTTNYVRAADLAVHLASGRTISTVWTARYADDLPPRQTAPSSAPTGATDNPEAKHRTSANDLKSGLVMSGRSPYIGALLYAGWVLGWFWPFVLLQAVIAYLLIIMVLRRFDLARASIITLVTLILSFTTSLPTYNSMLLADAFASFGMLSLVLLALPGRLSRWQVAFLVAVIVMSVIAHLTHLTMLAGMTGAIVLLRLVGWLRPPPRVWYAAIGAMIVAVLAMQATTYATRIAVGRPPQLLPLLTARFYADGPGEKFIEAGCEGRRFEACRIPMGKPFDNSSWLFSVEPETGAYMLATPEQRRLMGEQDVAFATAVLRAYPVEQIGASVHDTIRQLLWIDYDALNQGCGTGPECWESLPPVVRARFMQTPSGRNAWPRDLMNGILYAAVIASLLALAVTMPILARHDRDGFVRMRNVLIITGAGMLVCCFFGGAVADPQYRYQGRLIWLPVFFGLIAVLRARQIRRAEVVPQ